MSMVTLKDIVSELTLDVRSLTIYSVTNENGVPYEYEVQERNPELGEALVI